MFRFTILCSIVFFLFSGAPAPAQISGSKQEDAKFRASFKQFCNEGMDKKTEHKFSQKLAELTTLEAHSTASTPDCIKCTVSKSDESVRVRMNIEYYGGTTSRRYFAVLLIVVDTSADSAWIINKLEFDDSNNRIPGNKLRLAKLKQEWNRQLEE